MTSSTEALDYTVEENRYEKGSFNVWTPDTAGAIIGIGKDKKEALLNAMASLGSTIAKMAEEIE